MSVQGVPPDSNFASLRDKLAVAGGHLLVSTLRDMISGKVGCNLNQMVEEAYE